MCGSFLSELRVILRPPRCFSAGAFIHDARDVCGAAGKLEIPRNESPGGFEFPLGARRR